MNNNSSFETFVSGDKLLSGMLNDSIKFIVILFFAILFLKILFPRYLGHLKLWKHLKIVVLMFKFVTCLSAVFFVFFYNFAEHKIMFMPLNNMLFSTFLVGALAIWELLTMIADWLECFDTI
ncbi:hypothetical protein [Clostridium butyricum]|uniref:hypothetical protein n=1 Tax=Clostridium butyricum TaxID=1492 RepID=UPI0022E42CCF|nr:hypothetical protein [Clostridium butyricum]